MAFRIPLIYAELLHAQNLANVASLDDLQVALLGLGIELSADDFASALANENGAPSPQVKSSAPMATAPLVSAPSDALTFLAMKRVMAPPVEAAACRKLLALGISRKDCCFLAEKCGLTSKQIDAIVSQGSEYASSLVAIGRPREIHNIVSEMAICVGPVAEAPLAQQRPSVLGAAAAPSVPKCTDTVSNGYVKVRDEDPAERASRLAKIAADEKAREGRFIHTLNTATAAAPYNPAVKVTTTTSTSVTVGSSVDGFEVIDVSGRDC
ncbi:MAG: hypothetical protein EBU46_17145 [Nitrosomonadaceae bacterium]|jgi:hypothetical protein|nr:hypothetical protein [Nitrosomonadaceae bacterium]